MSFSRHLDPAAFRRRTPELIDVYLTAMHYPADLAGARGVLWEEHSRRDGFACVVAIGADDRDPRPGLRLPRRARAVVVLGGPPRGVGPRPGTGSSPTSSNSPNCTFTRTGRAAGSARPCCGQLAGDRPERRMLLSTPEGRTGRGGCTAGSASPTCCGTTGSPAIRGRSACSGATCRWPRPVRAEPPRPDQATPRPRASRRLTVSAASRLASGSRPMPPMFSAAVWNALTSNASPCRRRAASRPASHTRSPIL